MNVLLIENQSEKDIRIYKAEKSKKNFIIMDKIIDGFDSFYMAERYCFRFNLNVIGKIKNNNY